MMKKTTKKKSPIKKAKRQVNFTDTCKCGGAVYGLGFVGALIYYLSTATGLWNGVWGVIKAILWPAFLTFELMKYLGM